MNINVTGRHVGISDPMREYAREKVEKLEKFAQNMIIDAHIIMDVEKHRQKVEVTLKGRTFTIHAKEETGDMYSSIDILMERLEKKLHSIKGKLQDHHRTPVHEVDRILHVIHESHRESDLERTLAIKHESFDTKPLFLEDAISRLQDTHRNFLVFINAETNRVNVIHRVSEAAVGVIET